MTLCDRKGGRGSKVLKKRDIINEWTPIIVFKEMAEI